MVLTLAIKHMSGNKTDVKEDFGRTRYKRARTGIYVASLKAGGKLIDSKKIIVVK